MAKRTPAEGLASAKITAIERGGLCLSTEYKTARLPLIWQCKNNHKWEATPDNVIRSGRWCRQCAVTTSAAARTKYALEDCQLLAAKFNTKCISQTKPIRLKEYKWECANGHQYHGEPALLGQSGFACPKCKAENIKQLKASGQLPSFTTKYLELQKICTDKGGKLLSTSYHGAGKKIEIRCRDGHTWSAVAGSIKQGTWCPVCAGVTRKSIDDAISYAKKQGGKCLSTKYSRAKDKLQWECAEGHQWLATFDSVTHGTWCSICSFKLAGENSRKYTVEDLEAIAASRGGHFLSNEYRGALINHQWECNKGHKWMASPSSIINSNTWCATCSRYISERICNIAFETITGKQFTKARPKWLKSPKNTQMEFDGYCEELGIAWEHHGMQHYQATTSFKKSMPLKQRQEYDEQKAMLAKANNIVLVEIPQLGVYTKIDDLVQFIISALNKAGKGSVVKHLGKIDYSAAYISDDRSKELFKYAEAKGGRCLSNTYLGARYRYQWQCSQGHKWEQTLDAIKTGIWCPYCSGRHNVSLETAKDYAAANGGKCLSTDYKNVSTKMKFKCKEGHTFELTMSAARSHKRWCPTCK